MRGIGNADLFGPKALRASAGSALRLASAHAGAQFCVSPGLIEGAAPGGPAPLLPGVATATELMTGIAAGFTRFKLFPANVVGGIEALGPVQVGHRLRPPDAVYASASTRGLEKL